MFCDSCGATLQPGQVYCPRCGKTIVGSITTEGGRVARHAQLLGILWVAYSALELIGGLALMVLSHTVFSRHLWMEPGMPPPPPVPPFVRPLLTCLGIFLLAKAIAGLFAGIGILQRADWARVLAIVVGCIALFSLPFGTALGIYTLWVLLSPNAEADMRARSAGA